MTHGRRTQTFLGLVTALISLTVDRPVSGQSDQTPKSENSSLVVSGMNNGSIRAYQVAKPRLLPQDAPQASDVIMRALTLRESERIDRHDTFRALDDFHVSRLEWAYIHAPQAIHRVRESGRLFGGAASSALSHIAKTNAELDHAQLACVNLLGEPVIPTWKRAWNPPGNWWMCVNNPTLYRLYVDYLTACLDSGAQVMQRDEPGGNVNATTWGGCFCDHCMTAFRDYLEENSTRRQRKQWEIDSLMTFNYRKMLLRQKAPVGDDFNRFDGGPLKQHFFDFQTAATVKFHQAARRDLNAHAGRRVAFSCNNGCRRWTPIEMQFDWCFGELSYRHAVPDFIHDVMLDATSLDRCQVITMPKKADQEDAAGWQRLTRQTIAMAYACGGHCMAPWDVYMPGDAPRYFGTAQQYADLFAFIRASGDYLDDYQYAGALGPGIACDAYDAPPVILPSDRDLCAVIRAVPGESNRPVVVHLVDWSDNPRDFQLTLNPTAMFGDRPLRINLLTPTAYGEPAHATAEVSGDFSPLVQTRLIAEGYVPTVSIPALSPWGILVVEPIEPTPDSVWPPVIWAPDEATFRDSLTVKLSSATPDTVLHVTTDGTLPTTTSPQYIGPLTLTDAATVRAFALSDNGHQSPVTTVRFQRPPNSPVPTVPDAPALRESLALWLTADTLLLAAGQPVTTWPAQVGEDAVAQPHRTFNGRMTEPPTYQTEAIHGRPAIQFDGQDDSLVVPGFANRHLAGSGFTIFLVTQSTSPSFGICGNGISGGGGSPRLYLQRSQFRYGEFRSVVEMRPPDGTPAISTFTHDGRETIQAAANGILTRELTGVPMADRFGSGGNLAMPFWAGNTNCPGSVAEIIAYNRPLTQAERRNVEAHLADKYGIRCAKRWERVE